MPLAGHSLLAQHRRLRSLTKADRAPHVSSLLLCSLVWSSTGPLFDSTVPSTLLQRPCTSLWFSQAIKASPLVVFMKGNPAQPQCGFSRAVIQILDVHGVPMDKMHTYNCLDDQELREGIKEYSFVFCPLLIG